jgi:hypothetical protein
MAVMVIFQIYVRPVVPLVARNDFINSNFKPDPNPAAGARIDPGSNFSFPQPALL